MFNKRIPTDQARLLYNELINNNVNAILEYPDRYPEGVKYIDIGIPDSHLYIEVDGKDHFNNSDTIETYLKRDHYAEVDGFQTIHIPNQSIDEDVKRIARAIAKVVKHRREIIKETFLE